MALTTTQKRYLSTCRWDDASVQLVGRKIDVASGRIDYDYDELTVDFATNARYPQEPVGVPLQAPHSWAEHTVMRPHIHWLQSSADVPNWLIAYRQYNNGAAVPGSWTLKAANSPIFTYTSGTIMQISSFPEIEMPDMGLSCALDMKIFRDSGNASTLFAGADPLSAVAKLKFFDTHIPFDSMGSDVEFIKKSGEGR